MESFVRWKNDDDYFTKLMSKKFGSDLLKHRMEEKFRRNQVYFPKRSIERRTIKLAKLHSKSHFQEIVFVLFIA